LIAVIGGAGYIGSHTVKHLIELGEQVVVFDNLSTGHRECVPVELPFVKGDLASFENLHNFFAQYPNVHTVIHFADVGESVVEPAKYYRNNLVNTVNLLDAMLAHNMKNIVFSSTCAQFPTNDEHAQKMVVRS